MAKPKSSEIVDEEAEREREWEEMRETTKSNSDLIAKIAAKVLGTEPPEPKPKNEPKPPAETKSKSFLVRLGILRDTPPA